MPEDQLDLALAELRRSLSNAQTLGNILSALRDNTKRLAEPMRSVLEEARDAINHTLTLLPCLVVGSALLLGGCINAVELSKHLSKPKVTFATPAAWNCDQEVKVPGRYRDIETCQRCVNQSKGSQQISINDQADTVVPKGSVLVCATQALVE